MVDQKFTGSSPVRHPRCPVEYKSLGRVERLNRTLFLVCEEGKDGRDRLLSGVLSRAYYQKRDHGRLVTMLPNVQDVEIHGSSHEFGARYACLALQVRKLLDLLLRELNLCNRSCHAVSLRTHLPQLGSWPLSLDA